MRHVKLKPGMATNAAALSRLIDARLASENQDRLCSDSTQAEESKPHHHRKASGSVPLESQQTPEFAADQD
jgi:hypothetical protein